MGAVVHLGLLIRRKNGEWQRLQDLAAEMAEADLEHGTCCNCGARTLLRAGACAEGCAA